MYKYIKNSSNYNVEYRDGIKSEGDKSGCLVHIVASAAGSSRTGAPSSMEPTLLYARMFFPLSNAW